jgi:hypothetical protein
MVYLAKHPKGCVPKDARAPQGTKCAAEWGPQRPDPNWDDVPGKANQFGFAECNAHAGGDTVLFLRQ